MPVTPEQLRSKANYKPFNEAANNGVGMDGVIGLMAAAGPDDFLVGIQALIDSPNFSVEEIANAASPELRITDIRKPKEHLIFHLSERPEVSSVILNELRSKNQST